MLHRVPTRAVALICLVGLSLTVFPLSRKADDANASVLPQASGNRSVWVGPNALGVFVRKMIAGQTVCLEASIEQARRLKDRDPNLPLSVLNPDANPSGAQPGGLRIILRGTAQLQSFPLARAAFERAAARWESLIHTDITIVIDVDFGPNLFGKPFDETVVSSTDAQVLGGNALYPAMRAGLNDEAFDPEKSSLYNSLPAKAVPTDRGESAGMTASTATLRAMGLINQVADPDTELSRFGPPPAIGLNAKFKFDFNPDDGSDQDELDFEAIALHDIGHVLGFISFVGQQEMDAAIDVEPSPWDLFRVRPDAIKSDFATAERRLSSGGEQSFYAGGAMLALSTGRPDGTGGDGRQAAHWKDDNLTGQYLGVMDPTIRPGEHHLITDNDVSVLDALGYRISGVSDPTTLIPLNSSQPQTGGMIAPPPNLGVVSHTQYTIAVPRDATQLRIDLNGDQDVDLFARFGQIVFIQGYHPATDYVSKSPTGAESITITPTSSPPLRRGIYYIAVANFGPGEAAFTVKATVTGGSNSHAPAIFNLGAHLDGDVLGLDVAAIDGDGDFASADVSLLDEAGRAVSPSSSVALNSGTATQVESQLAISGLRAMLTAWRASLVFIDRSGNRSAEATVDFSKAQVGGLTVTGAVFNGAKLKVNGRGLGDALELEINGQTVARKITANNSGNKLTIKGGADQLGLRRGANRLRVKNAHGWSNIFILDT